MSVRELITRSMISLLGSKLMWRVPTQETNFMSQALRHRQGVGRSPVPETTAKQSRCNYVRLDEPV